MLQTALWSIIHLLHCIHDEERLICRCQRLLLLLQLCCLLYMPPVSVALVDLYAVGEEWGWGSLGIQPLELGATHSPLSEVEPSVVLVGILV